MNTKSCSFFGHRKIEITTQLKNNLKDIVENLIVSHNVYNFLFGSKSNFNQLCHLVVSELKIKYPYIQRIAYTCKSETCILEKDKSKWENVFKNSTIGIPYLLYAESEYEHKTKYTSGVASYIERNQSMILNSEYCIFYYDENYNPPKRKLSKSSLSDYQPNSGTAIAFNFATQKKKIIINLFKQ